MRKVITVIVKVIVIVSAAATLILRLLTYKMFETMDEALRTQLNTVAYIAAGVVLVSGIAWVMLEKLGGNNEKKTYEYILPDLDGDGKTEDSAETETEDISEAGTEENTAEEQD